MRAIITLALLAIVAALTGCATASGSGKSYYYIDRQDNGDNATTAGCHVQYLTSACAGDRYILGVTGDVCESGNASVHEYTNDTACHRHDNRTSPADLNSRNCDTACGSRGGTCVVAERACTFGTITADSAYCQCNE